MKPLNWKIYKILQSAKMTMSDMRAAPNNNIITISARNGIIIMNHKKGRNARQISSTVGSSEEYVRKVIAYANL